MTEKIYCGSGKTVNGNYGDFYKASLRLEELEKYVSDKGYVKIVLSKRQTPDKFGNDLSVTIDTYKPNIPEGGETPVKTQNNNGYKGDGLISIEDIPFS